MNYSDIRNCLIAGNLAAHCYGRGIYLINNLGGTVSACTVVDNEVRDSESTTRCEILSLTLIIYIIALSIPTAGAAQ